jgi:hypothetical protein
MRDLQGVSLGSEKTLVGRFFVKVFFNNDRLKGGGKIMFISSYHVNNVLRVYGDQLRQTRTSNSTDNPKTGSSDGIGTSDKAKRRVVVDKIASDIIEKVTNYRPDENAEEDVSQNLENTSSLQQDVTEKNPNDLLFKMIDENGETLNSLSIENSEFLRYKLEEVKKETGEKSRNSEPED